MWPRRLVAERTGLASLLFMGALLCVACPSRVAFAQELLAPTNAPRTAPGVTPDTSQCNDAAKKDLHRLFEAAYEATADNFPAAYRNYNAMWNALLSTCQHADKDAGHYDPNKPLAGPETSALIASVNALDPWDLAVQKVKTAPADIDAARDLLRLSTDEASINALSTRVKQTIALANAAYGAVAASEQWPAYTCARDGYLTSNATLAVPEAHPSPKDGEEETANAYCAALFAYGNFNYQASRRRGAIKSLCGGFSADGQYRRVCLTYGAISSALSYIWKTGQDPAGMAGTAVLSLIVPYAGVRFTPFDDEFGRFLSFDVNIYSAFLTTGTLQNPQTTPCIANGNALERSFRCETNPVIHPYGAIGAGLTVGEDKVGYFSLMPLSFGYAQFGAQGIHPYFGMYASILQLTGRF